MKEGRDIENLKLHEVLNKCFLYVENRTNNLRPHKEQRLLSDLGLSGLL